MEESVGDGDIVVYIALHAEMHACYTESNKDHKEFLNVLNMLSFGGTSVLHSLFLTLKNDFINSINSLLQEDSVFGFQFQSRWFDMLPEEIRILVDQDIVESSLKFLKMKAKVLDSENTEKEGFFKNRRKTLSARSAKEVSQNANTFLPGRGSKSVSPRSFGEVVEKWKNNRAFRKAKKEQEKQLGQRKKFHFRESKR